MTILGIGIDIIKIKRIKYIYKKNKNKFSKKILTKKEISEYKKKKDKINYLAKKFTSKEAISKALGTGINKGINFKSFEIYHNKYGKPKIKLFNKALSIFKKKKATRINISITDEKKYAQSIVIISN